MAIGDHLFKQMWEPHQLSAYPVAFFVRIFLFITGGSTTGIVVYLRIIGCIIHAIISVFLYRALTAYIDNYNAALISLINCLFLPKWVQIPEFELMQYWFLILVFVCFSFCYKKSKHRKMNLILAGFFTLLMMTSYPTMCVLFIPCSILILKLSENKKQDLLLYSAGFFGAGIIVLAYIFAFVTPSSFINNLHYIFMDESHTTEIGFKKVLLFSMQILNSLVINLIAVSASFLVVALCVCIANRTNKKSFKDSIRNIVLYSLILSSGALIVYDIINVAFFDTNIFICSHFYYSVIILGLYTFIAYPIKEDLIPFLLLFISGILSVAAISIMTNMSINVIISHCFPCLLATLIFIVTLSKNTDINRNIFKIVSSLYIVSTIGILLFSRLLAIRVNGCLPVTIRAGLEKMTRGPLAGLYVVDDDAYYYNGLMDIIDSHDTSGRLLYIGGETWIYTYKPSTVCAASTQGTSSYNDAFIEYYDLYPDKLPNLVVMDTQLGVNPAYNTTTVQSSMLNWLDNTYPFTYKENEIFAIVYEK